MANLMTRAEYKTLPKDKVDDFRAARKNIRAAQKRAGIARLPAKRAARQAYHVKWFGEQEAIRAQWYAAMHQRHYSRQYFEITTMWEWNKLYLWIPKEVQ